MLLVTQNASTSATRPFAYTWVIDRNQPLPQKMFYPQEMFQDIPVNQKGDTSNDK